ncbi:MAG: ATP-binding protein [Rhizobiales bacterium 65-9]|nr:DNA-packaging protein [Hyphomicrobiales bacterium]OJY37864.1 MAG: ATP-binding protein [Rhizobiales bacterium 65-9]
MATDWEFLGRDDQFPPDGDWTVWLMLGGRGAGKTRAGAEWVRALALGLPPFADKPVSPIALVGETAADVREVMIDGVSGLRAVHPARQRPTYEATRRRLVWPNGAVAQCFSAEDPDQLRGPQFAAAWADEIAKWRYADAAWDNLQFALRLGDRPRELATTTPRPVPLLKRLLGDPKTAVTRAKTSANIYQLAPAFYDAVVARYVGTRLGRQELDGELIEDREGALFSRALIEASRVSGAPPLARIVVAVDPPASSTRRADACGIVAAGIDAAGVMFVLADDTASAARPAEWARRALALFHRFQADAIVAEVNQGGDMVAAVLREADENAPVIAARATRGKYLRAEPVAHLMEQGRVKFCGAFPALEDEMCDFSAGGLSSGRSPDRLDAFVWAVTALTRAGSNGPRVRAI